MSISAGSGNASGVAKRVVYVMAVENDPGNKAVFEVLGKAAADANKRMVSGAESTAKKVADAHEKEQMRWGGQLAKQIDKQQKEWEKSNAGLLKDDEKLSRDLGKLWTKHEEDRRKAAEQTARVNEAHNKSLLRDAASLRSQLGGVADSAISFGKAISIGSLVGEKNMESLVSKLLAIQGGFEGVRSGMSLIGGIRGAAATAQRVVGAGPGSFGAEIAAATGSAAAGHAAWKFAGSGVGAAALRGLGAAAPYAGPIGLAGAAAAGLGVSAYNVATGNTSHAGFDYLPDSFTAPHGDWHVPFPIGFQKFASNIPGFGPGGWLAQAAIYGENRTADAKRAKELARAERTRTSFQEWHARQEDNSSLMQRMLAQDIEGGAATLGAARGDLDSASQFRQSANLTLEQKQIGFGQLPQYEQNRQTKLDNKAEENPASLTDHEIQEIITNPLSAAGAFRAARSEAAKRGAKAEERVGGRYTEEHADVKNAEFLQQEGEEIVKGVEQRQEVLKNVMSDAMKPATERLLEVLRDVMESVGQKQKDYILKTIIEMQQNAKNAG